MKSEGMKNSDRNYERNQNRYMDNDVPKFTFPSKGMRARAAYQLIHDELNLDGNPDLNLATFVTTWMEPEANDTTIMRVVVRENSTPDMVDIFVQDLMNAEKALENGIPSPTRAYSQKAHSVS